MTKVPQVASPQWSRATVSVLIAAVATLLLGVMTAPTTAAVAVKPGRVGTAITLGTHVALSGYDVATTPDGTAYVGWIATPTAAADRTVYLCVLPKDATACQGGVKSTPSLGISSASGLRVLVVKKVVRLVWFHDTPSSTSDDNGARIAVSTVHGTSLGAAVDLPDGVISFGALYGAAVSGAGHFWAVTGRIGEAYQLVDWTMSDGSVAASRRVALTVPWDLGKARIAFSKGLPVLVVDKYGAITEPLRVKYLSDSGGTQKWSSWAKVAHSWNVGGDFDLLTAKGQPRLVSSVANASYYPTYSSWTGKKFGARHLTGDKDSCPKSSHDLATDASGRLADVYLGCGKVTVVNQPTRGKAALVRFSVGGTAGGGDPQIASLPSGRAWVVWSRESGVDGDALLVTAFRLKALTTSKRTTTVAGQVGVSGPVSCLPAVQTTVGVSAAGKNGWRVSSKSLKLDGKKVGKTLNGAGLRAGSSHTLVGTASLAKSGSTRALTATLRFTVCPNP